MMTIPNIIDPSVPIGKDDSENVEIERFGEPVVPDFEIPYHTDIRHVLTASTWMLQAEWQQWILLSDGGYCKTAFRCNCLRT